MNNKIKAFYKKHENKINNVAFALSAIGIVMLTAKLMAKENKTSDDLTEEEWEQIMDLARQLDENVAARKALKSK